jgi:hypothetical protein
VLNSRNGPSCCFFWQGFKRRWTEQCQPLAEMLSLNRKTKMRWVRMTLVGGEPKAVYAARR